MTNGNDQEKITYFGETDSRNKRVKFGIKAKDRTKHVYVIGKTGMGKSTVLENMAIQDIKNGEGMAFIDPHGKTADLLIEHVPIERINDVVYFAPFDLEYPVSFNVLEDIGADKRHLVVSGLMSTFKKIWLDAWSARMEYILTNTLLALLEYPDATLLGVNRMLSDKDYRKKVVENLKDASVRSFWVDEFAKYTERQAAEAVPAIQNKIGQFTSNPLIRNIIGQPKSSFDIRKVMDEKKILIINLSKGRVGEANANLLGSMLITKIYLAAMSRADTSERDLKKLPNFYLYVDEFQSFANESFADILSEARKYKLNLNIAHQYIEQMSEEVRAAVFGNVGTMIAFRVGAYDAEVLEKEFAPQFTAEDLVNLGIYQMYLKLMIDGVSSVPFSATGLPPFPIPAISYFPEIIAASRKQFAKERKEVESNINLWHEQGRPGSKSSEKAPIRPQGARNELFKREAPREMQREVRREIPRETPKEAPKEPPKIFEKFVKKFTEPKPYVETEKKSEEPKKKIELPPIENEPGDDFMSLKDLSKNIIEAKPAEEKKKGHHEKKVMSKENLAGLKSILDSVLAKAKTSVKEEPIKQRTETRDEIKKTEEKFEEKKQEPEVKREEKKAEPEIKREEKKVEEKPMDKGPKEISESDLKKILGID